MQALKGVGIDWTFAAEGEDEAGATGVLTRLTAVGVSVGGMLVTALMLGIVSGVCVVCISTHLCYQLFTRPASKPQMGRTNHCSIQMMWKVHLPGTCCMHACAPACSLRPCSACPACIPAGRLTCGCLADTISEKIEGLRKGRSDVLESGHTLILGWSDKASHAV